MKKILKMIKYFYYDIKSYFWAISKYHKIVKKMKPWDGCYIYQMVKFQLEILLPQIENGNEEEISKAEKIKDIKRLIYLLNNSIEDKYSEICGYDFNYNITFEKRNDGSYEMKDDETIEQNNNNIRAIEDSKKLEEKELKEIGFLFSKVTCWWN
jgi:hypothetical protein